MHILNVAVGDTPEMDHANTVIMQCSRQIDLVCSGLRSLDQSGRLHFFGVDGKHVQIDYDWVAEYIIPFLL